MLRSRKRLHDRIDKTCDADSPDILHTTDNPATSFPVEVHSLTRSSICRTSGCDGEVLSLAEEYSRPLSDVSVLPRDDARSRNAVGGVAVAPSQRFSKSIAV